MLRLLPLALIAMATPALAANQLSEGPDIFGSIALELDQTPFDAKLQKARTGTISAADRKWAKALTGTVAERIQQVNDKVNAQVQYTDDPTDIWQSSSITLNKNAGDCEDYALAKMALLEAAGLRSSDLVLTIVRDLVLRRDHAMLVVKDGQKFMLLDNVTNRIVDAKLPADYRPVLSYSGSGQKWTHGFQTF